MWTWKYSWRKVTGHFSAEAQLVTEQDGVYNNIEKEFAVFWIVADLIEMY